MELELRGHHLLCVHGFQGMGYSPDFVEKMKMIVEKIRNDDMDFQVKVIAQFDEACSACPHKGELVCEASEGSQEHVLAMDSKVIHHLGLNEGASYSKSDLVQLTAQMVDPDDLDYLCQDCSWLKFGVCKEGIRSLNAKMRK